MFSQKRRVSNAWIVLIAIMGVLQLAAADTEANKASGRRGFEEVWNQGRMDVVDELLATDYVYHDPAMGDMPGTEAL